MPICKLRRIKIRGVKPVYYVIDVKNKQYWARRHPCLTLLKVLIGSVKWPLKLILIVPKVFRKIKENWSKNNQQIFYWLHSGHADHGLAVQETLITPPWKLAVSLGYAISGIHLASTTGMVALDQLEIERSNLLLSRIHCWCHGDSPGFQET